MAYIAISDTFFADPKVAGVGNEAIGCWVLLASYHAAWPTYDIPLGAARMCGSKPRHIKRLLETGWLVEAEQGWRLGYEGTGLWKLVRTPEARRPIPAAVRSAVMERDDYTCRFCDATHDLTLDHIHPYSLGGPDTVENLRVLCRRCNSARGNRVEVVE